MLALALVALLKPGGPSPQLRPHVPLIVVCAVLVLLALSHQVAWGDRVVLEVPIADKPLELGGDAARVGTVAVARDVRAHLCRVRDRRGALLAARRDASSSSPASPCSSPTCRRASPRCAATSTTASSSRPHCARARSPRRSGPRRRSTTARSAMAPVANTARGWEWLALYAVDNGMAINTGQFARVSFPRIAKAERGDHDDTRRGKARPGHALPAVVEGGEVRLCDRPGRRDRRDRRLPRHRTRLVRAAARSIAPDHLVRGPRRGIGP